MEEVESDCEAEPEVSADFVLGLMKENQALRIVIASGLGYEVPDNIPALEVNMAKIQSVLDVHMTKLVELRAANAQTSGLLVAFPNMVTREMPVDREFFKKTVKQAKEFVLTFLGKNKFKMDYRKFVFITGDGVVMSNNRVNIINYVNSMGQRINVAPTGSGGAKTIRLNNMVKGQEKHTMNVEQLKAIASSVPAELRGLITVQKLETDISKFVSDIETKGAKTTFVELTKSFYLQNPQAYEELRKYLDETNTGSVDSKLNKVAEQMFHLEVFVGHIEGLIKAVDAGKMALRVCYDKMAQETTRRFNFSTFVELFANVKAVASASASHDAMVP